MDNPMQLYFCSYEGKIKEIMAKHNGSEFWDVCLYININFFKNKKQRLIKKNQLKRLKTCTRIM